MKHYAVTITDCDCPWGEAMKCAAANKTEARYGLGYQEFTL